MIDKGSRPAGRVPIIGALLLCGVLSQSAVLLANPGLSPGVQGTTHKIEGRQALQHAARLVQEGRLDEAAAEAQRALSDPDAKAAAYSVLGAIRLQQKRIEESASLLEKAVKLEPRLLGAHLNLARVYTLQGRPASALGMLRRVLELDPSNATAAAGLAEFKQSPDALIALASDHLKSGDKVSAAALAKDWTALAGVPVSSSITFALLLADGGAVPEAIAVLESARTAGPPTYELAFNLGSAYLLNRDPDAALEAYDVALGLQPDALQALRQAAGVAEERRELERSLSYWMRAKKIAPDDPEILLGFGRVCLKMDLLDDAEPALEKAARLRPDETTYQYTLAAAKVGKRQFEAAQSLLEPMVAKRPQDPYLLYALGSVLYIQGRLDEAAAHLRESARLQPEQLPSHYYLALVARDQGNEVEAIRILEALLKRHPDHAASSEALGGLLMSAGRYPDAETHLRTAVRLNPTSVKANYQLGLLLARMGKKEEADKQLALTKSLREEDAATSRLQLRLVDPDR